MSDAQKKRKVSEILYFILYSTDDSQHSLMKCDWTVVFMTSCFSRVVSSQSQPVC